MMFSMTNHEMSKYRLMYYETLYNSSITFVHFSAPSKSTDDLLGLNFFGSSASTPTGGGYNLPSPMSPMSDGAIPNSDITHSSSSELFICNAPKKQTTKLRLKIFEKLSI